MIPLIPFCEVPFLCFPASSCIFSPLLEQDGRYQVHAVVHAGCSFASRTIWVLKHAQWGCFYSQYLLCVVTLRCLCEYLELVREVNVAASYRELCFISFQLVPKQLNHLTVYGCFRFHLFMSRAWSSGSQQGCSWSPRVHLRSLLIIWQHICLKGPLLSAEFDLIVEKSGCSCLVAHQVWFNLNIYCFGQKNGFTFFFQCCWRCKHLTVSSGSTYVVVFGSTYFEKFLL